MLCRMSASVKVVLYMMGLMAIALLEPRAIADPTDLSEPISSFEMCKVCLKSGGIDPVCEDIYSLGVDISWDNSACASVGCSSSDDDERTHAQNCFVAGAAAAAEAQASSLAAELAATSQGYVNVSNPADVRFGSDSNVLNLFIEGVTSGSVVESNLATIVKGLLGFYTDDGIADVTNSTTAARVAMLTQGLTPRVCQTVAQLALDVWNHGGNTNMGERFVQIHGNGPPTGWFFRPALTIDGASLIAECLLTTEKGLGNRGQASYSSYYSKVITGAMFSSPTLATTTTSTTAHSFSTEVTHSRTMTDGTTATPFVGALLLTAVIRIAFNA